MRCCVSVFGLSVFPVEGPLKSVKHRGYTFSIGVVTGDKAGTLSLDFFDGQNVLLKIRVPDLSFFLYVLTFVEDIRRGSVYKCKWGG